MPKVSVHDQRVRKLSRELSDVIEDLGRTYVVALEPELRSKTKTVGAPDIYVFDGHNHHYIEYKCNARQRHHAISQLRKGRDFARQHLGYDPVLWYVYGSKFESERVR